MASAREGGENPGIRRVLFVCTGNTCRSPMAEALLKDALRDLPEMEIGSAGLSAFPGEPASRGARQAMRERGLSLEGHHARPATRALLEEADLVLCMTGAHAQAAMTKAPGARIATLGGYVGREQDVMDPFGGDARVYEACAQQLERLIGRLTPMLRGEPG